VQPQPLDYITLVPQRHRLLPVAIHIARRWWPVPIILLALFVFGLWEVIGRHIDEGRPGTPSEIADFTSVAPPAEASKIWVASYREGPMAFSHYVRFEAPPGICLQYAARVAPGRVLTPFDGNVGSFDADIFKDMSWFDLDKAENLVNASGRANRPNATIWVDQKRSVFYFNEHD
jgi:hypothetical protein